MVNKFIGIGNLCDDPRIQEYGDKKKCYFSIAINHTKNEALFLNVECWNNVAENCNKFLSKGSCAYIEGRIKSSKWQDKSGNQRTNFFVSADMVRFLPNGKREEKKEEENIEKEHVNPSISSILQETEPPF